MMPDQMPMIEDEVELAIELTVAEFSHSPRLGKREIVQLTLYPDLDLESNPFSSLCTTELSFPSSLTSDERLHVHKVAAKYRLGSVTQAYVLFDFQCLFSSPRS
jgi:hypothetical protein